MKRKRTCYYRIFIFLLLALLFLDGKPLLATEKELTFLEIHDFLEKSYPSIQRALETREELFREWGIARAYYSPSLSITTIPFHIHDQGSSYLETALQGNLNLVQGLTLRSDFKLSPTDLDYSYQLRASYTFFQDPYLLPSYLKIEDLESQIAMVEKELALLRGEALLEVLQLLFRLEESKTRYSLAFEDLEEAKGDLEKARARLEVGVGEETSLLLRELQVKQRELELIRREHALEGASRDLFDLLGLEDGGVAFPSIDLTITEPPLSQEEILTKILSNSSQLQEAHRRIEREEKALERELAKKYPQTTLSGEFRYDSARDETWSIMLQMSYPLFDGGEQGFALKEREVALEKALLAYEKEEEKIKDRAEVLWKAVQLKKKDIEMASLHYEIKVLEVMQSEEKERRGLLDTTKLMEIHREYIEAHLQRLEALQAYLLLHLEIELLSGADILDIMMMR